MRLSRQAALSIVVGSALTLITVGDRGPEVESLGAALGSRVLDPPEAGLFNEEFEGCLLERSVVLADDLRPRDAVDAWTLSPLEYARTYGFGILNQPDGPPEPEHRFLTTEGRQLSHGEKVTHSESCAAQVTERIEEEDAIIERELGTELAVATERVEDFVAESSARWSDCIAGSEDIPFDISSPDDIEMVVLPYFQRIAERSSEGESNELSSAIELEVHVATVVQECWLPIQSDVEALRANIERELLGDGKLDMDSVAAEIRSVWSRGYVQEDI